MFCCMKKRKTAKEEDVSKKPIEQLPEEEETDPIPEESEKKDNESASKKTTEEENGRPQNYDKLIKDSYPEGLYYPNEENNPYNMDLINCCIHVSESDNLKNHFLMQYDIELDNLTSEGFDEWCKEEGYWNCLGKFQEYVQSKTTDTGFLEQVKMISVNHNVNFEVSDMFEVKSDDDDDDKEQRAVVIMGEIEEDVAIATNKYKNLLLGIPEIETEKEPMAIIDESLSEFQIRRRKVLAGDDGLNDSSCEERDVAYAHHGDVIASQKIYDLYKESKTSHSKNKPGLFKLGEELYEYNMFLPFEYPLYKTPIKFYNRQFALKNVAILEKKESTVYRGHRFHVVAILGKNAVEVISVRNTLASECKAFSLAAFDVKKIEEILLIKPNLTD